MLYKVIAGKDVFELNPELKAIEEFEPLTARQMLYVIFSTDYKSPMRKLKSEDKKFRAALEAGYKLEKDGKRLDTNGRNLILGKTDRVEKAIKKYKILQKDEDYETILGLSRLISDIRDFNTAANKSATEIEKAIKFSKDLPTLIKAKREIEDILEMREDEVSAVPDATNADLDIKDTALSILATINEDITDEN
jgi:hypothetical protein